jgi:hypothetical protein
MLDRERARRPGRALKVRWPASQSPAVRRAIDNDASCGLTPQGQGSSSKWRMLATSALPSVGLGVPDRCQIVRGTTGNTGH